MLSQKLLKQPCHLRLRQISRSFANNNGKKGYSTRQIIIKNGVYVLMFGITGGALYFLYNFQTYYINPRKEYLEQNSMSNSYSVSLKTREKMIKEMAKQFQEEMVFITNKNQEINGDDLLRINNDIKKHFILYFGYPNCNDNCQEILKLIKKCTKSNNKSVQILYIDLNIYDSAQKLDKYLIDDNDGNDIDMIGLIPKNMTTLRQLMDSFYIFIKKTNHEENDENMKLNHSNVIYYVDFDGLLYDISVFDKNADIESNEKIINEKVYNLIHFSESTFLGKIRNILSLTFQTTEIQQMPDRYVDNVAAQ